MRILALTVSALLLIASNIPKTWNKDDVNSMELPLAQSRFSPTHVDETSYYRIPERVLYKSYPVYAPGFGPPGYLQHLKTLEPESAFSTSTSRSEAQWVSAGEVVFNSPTSFQPVFFTAEDLQDPNFFKEIGMPIAKDGTIPFARWVIRRKGVVELGSMSCATCHTRVLADGTVIPGAQGNNPGDREGVRLLRRSAKMIGPERILTQVRAFVQQFQSPWVPDDINRLATTMNLDELIAAGEAIPPGVTARANTSVLLPPQIPDLIGVQEHRFLDHTGLVRQRGIGDLMRYSSLAQDVFSDDRYGSMMQTGNSHPVARYSDAQLYALAKYVYSLQPPRNPNNFTPSAARGKSIFMREKCGICHTPPLYTNNRLVPVEGFRRESNPAEVMSVSIGVDPRYTLQTHKGTGYYKVPSLKGLWYRGPFGHNGSAATLEDWFDPARLDPDYVPTGFKGYDGKTRSIPGHRFGLDLSHQEREDLIAFLKAL